CRADREADRIFNAAWRDELLARTWAALRQAQPRWYEVLHFRARHPKMPSSQMAQALSQQLGRPVTADGGRQARHRARDKSADLPREGVIHPRPRAGEADLLEELGELGLLDSCEPALTRRGQAFGRASQRRTVPSPLPETRIRPSPEKRNE